MGVPELRSSSMVGRVVRSRVFIDGAQKVRKCAPAKTVKREDGICRMQAERWSLLGQFPHSSDDQNKLRAGSPYHLWRRHSPSMAQDWYPRSQAKWPLQTQWSG